MLKKKKFFPGMHRIFINSRGGGGGYSEYAGRSAPSGGGGASAGGGGRSGEDAVQMFQMDVPEKCFICQVNDVEEGLPVCTRCAHGFYLFYESWSPQVRRLYHTNVPAFVDVFRNYLQSHDIQFIGTYLQTNGEETFDKLAKLMNTMKTRMQHAVTLRADHRTDGGEAHEMSAVGGAGPRRRRDSVCRLCQGPIEPGWDLNMCVQCISLTRTMKNQTQMDMPVFIGQIRKNPIAFLQDFDTFKTMARIADQDVRDWVDRVHTDPIYQSTIRRETEQIDRILKVKSRCNICRNVGVKRESPTCHHCLQTYYLIMLIMRQLSGGNQIDYDELIPYDQLIDYTRENPQTIYNWLRDLNKIFPEYKTIPMEEIPSMKEWLKDRTNSERARNAIRILREILQPGV